MDNQFDELLELGKRIRRRDLLGVLVLLAGIVVTVFFYGTPFFVIGLGIMAASIIMMIVTSVTLNKRFRKMYKSTMIDRVAREYFEQYTYNAEKGFSRDYLRGLGIMMFGSDYRSEDMLAGSYHGVPFTRADVYIADTSTDSEGNSSTTVYFRGQWLELIPNKQFASDLQIIQKGFGFSNKRKGFFTKKADRRHEMETEDSEFNKRFTCMCQDEAEAFYLLTPALMQAIMRLSEVLPYKMMIAFVGNTLQVLIDTHRDSMEPTLPKGGNFDRQIADIHQDMRVITEVITGLLQDRNIFRA
ncbi:MAG: DUF3137 domain-containing protein [Lachnospiraceae bacterium]|nr:DUF3137 domain-containing protein [Lachnospiraceae bacterium]